MMPHYSQEEIEKARKMDLYTYLRLYEPEELVRVNSREFCTRTHDSLKISNGMWMWWSRQIGGRSALDYLVKVRGKPFAEAVQIINGQEAVRPPVFLSEQSQKIVRKLLIPDQSKRNDEVIRYLESRCIDDEIIDYCIDNGLLYESKKFHSCIFLGFDEQLKDATTFRRRTTRFQMCFQQLPDEFSTNQFATTFGYANNRSASKAIERLLTDKAIERTKRGEYRKRVKNID